LHADGLYLKLAAEEAKVQADRPVKLRLSAVVTRSFTLPTAPEFLVDDGTGMKARPEIQVRAIDAKEGAVSVSPEAPLQASWEIVLPRAGRYRIQARYRLSDRVVQSNKVSVEVGGTQTGATQ
jgi:hypothetical protein